MAAEIFGSGGLGSSMLIIRAVGRVAAASLVLCWLALPSAADGLTRFKEAIKDAPPEALTFKSAKPLGDNGFVLEGVVVTPPPDSTPAGKTEPIEIKRVAVEDFDFAAIDKNAPPTFIKMRVEGIVIGAKPAEGVDLAEMVGIDKITADFQLDYRLDPEKKTMSLNRLELDLVGLARLELSMILDGVSAESVDKPETAMNDATLRTATLLFEDRSLFSKVLPAAAKMQSVEPAALVKIGKVMLDGVRIGQGPATVAVLDALGSYLDDYKQPKGPLRVTLNPPGKTTAATLTGMTNPDEIIGALGLQVSYAGTKPGPAPAQSAAPGAKAASAPADGGGKAGCSPGARFFVQRDDAYWSVTAREASKSGDRCIARLDGGGDDDVTFALDKALAWSIDGPGKPVAKCTSGDKVLVAFKDGGWYGAKVTGNAAAGAKCPIQYDTDDEKESVELKKVRRLD
jgi:hypothetical protein